MTWWDERRVACKSGSPSEAYHANRLARWLEVEMQPLFALEWLAEAMHWVGLATRLDLRTEKEGA